jgi:DNA-binding transcriptional MerR regulator
VINGLTISQVAAFVGVTVKTVRHYHRLGLVEEPERDESGYRRYGPDHVLRLVQVRTLARAGVPLAEIGTMLDAGPDRFAAALVDVERRLNNRIEELIARRDTLHRLAHGDRVLLPDRACALLDRLPGLGFTAGDVALAREGLILVRALVPESFDDHLSQTERVLDDRVYVELFMGMWRAAEWEPDDPRVDELATAVADHLIANPSLLAIPTGFLARDDGATRYELLSQYGDEKSPTWARLNDLIETNLRSAGMGITQQFTGWVR